MEYLYQEESSRINGACFEVLNQLGHIFLEPVYREALKIELYSQKITFIIDKMISCIL